VLNKIKRVIREQQGIIGSTVVSVEKQELVLVSTNPWFGIGSSLRFEALLAKDSKLDFENIKLTTADGQVVQHCGHMDANKLRGHDKGSPIEVTKKKASSFSVRIVCTGSHGSSFGSIECKLTIGAKRPDGTTTELTSRAFVLNGSRDKKREPRLPRPYKAPIGSDQTNNSTVEETAHQQPKSSPEPTPLQLLPYLEGDFLSDFRGCRLVN